MDVNYTLKYRTFDELLQEALIDLEDLNLQGKIRPAQLIKVALRVNYDLGLRVNMTKEAVLEVDKGRARLPENFYVMNFALLCGEYQTTYVPAQGTTVQEVVPLYRPMGDAAACDNPEVPVNPCYPDRALPVCFTRCGGAYQLVQTINFETRTYRTFMPIRFRDSKLVDCSCPNLKMMCSDEAYIKDNFVWTSFKTGQLYINYQASLEDEDGNLMVPDHPFLNEYYEYALKQRIIENLINSGENLSAQFQIVEARLRAARNNALTVVNTPNFSEMAKVFALNRKMMYDRYYSMFSSYPWGSTFRANNAV